MAANLFEAAYEGKCPRCNEPIEPGDSIAYHPDYAKPCCNNCIRETKEHEVCTTCWLTHAGECP